MTNSRDTARALVPVVGAAVVALAPIEMDGHARSALAISVAMVLCWVAEVLHPAVVGFVGCFLFRATGDVEFDKAFAGFGTTTPWFLYGALLLFGAADRSGLVRWLGAHTPRPLHASLVAASLTLITLSYLLSLVVPSTLARGVMMAILAVAWTHEPRNPGTAEPRSPALILIAVYSAAMFARADMPLDPAALAGWNFVAALALLGGVAWSTAATGRLQGTVVTQESSSPALNLTLAVPVLVAAGLWATTPVHGLSPALVGLGAGLACCLPGFTSPGDRPANPDPLAIIFVGAAMSIPVVLVETKAADALSHLWVTANQWGAGGLPANLVAYWTTTAYRLFSPEGGQPALPAPDGLSAVWALAGVTMLAIHQSPALIFGLSVGGLRPRQVLIAGLTVLFAGSFVVMLI